MSAKAKVFLVLTLLFAIASIVMSAMGNGGSAGPVVIATFVAMALLFMSVPAIKGFAFSVWVFASVAAAMYYPPLFGTWFGYDLKIFIVPLIQIIMFGMGTTLTVDDFVRVFKMPLPILLGILLQFGAKPAIALFTAKLFGFTGEIAAGVVLIGSVPGGVASNLMTYLASGDVALSVTMTSFSTLVSPFATPFAMQKFGGQFITINFISMMLSILNMVIVPVVAGLIANRILYSKEKWANRANTIGMIGTVSLIVFLLAVFGKGLFIGFTAQLRTGILLAGILMAATSYAKLIVSIMMNGPENWMDKVLPMVSMWGIVLIIAIITARSAADLVSVGAALIVCSLIQISCGYILGYWLSKALRMKEKTARTVSIEVGLQNGGLASALAINVLQSAQAALASAIYGPLMNITGSILATWWHRNPVKDDEK